MPTDVNKVSLAALFIRTGSDSISHQPVRGVSSQIATGSLVLTLAFALDLDLSIVIRFRLRAAMTATEARKQSVGRHVEGSMIKIWADRTSRDQRCVLVGHQVREMETR